MKLQLIGTKKCKDTQKAMRFLKERSIDFAFVDLQEKLLAKGEFDKVFRVLKEDAIDRECKAYKNGGWEYKDFDLGEELFEHQELLKTPILRHDAFILNGFDAKIWQGKIL